MGKVKTSQQNQFFPYFASIDSLLNVSRGGGKKTIKPAVICIHGFGGNADQFRKNLPVLSANGYDTYAIDLLGYGYSDKPNPKQYEVNEVYNFENWAALIVQFIEKEVKRPCVLVCNSVGGLVGLQAAVDRQDLVQGLVLIDISLRMLHKKKQSVFIAPFVSAIQYVLPETQLGSYFFKQVSTPTGVKNILNQAYGYDGISRSVDDETVALILEPGLQPGATDVFLDFISYSGGPLPEELLPNVQCPVSMLWGQNDPWEPIDTGMTSLSGFPCVKEFVPLPNGGHCPMDQIPDTVNREVLRFLSDIIL